MPQMRLLLAGAMLLAALAGCAEEAAPPDYVARAGDAYLTQAELAEALEALSAGRDSADARKQVIEQWITNALLFQEAERRGLRNDPDVQRRLRENERSVLVSSLITRLHDEAAAPPTQAEMETYLAQHREQLRLREPFARIRHLATADAEAASQARRRLQEAQVAGRADSLWPALARRYAEDPAQALRLAQSYYPERRLAAEVPAARDLIGRLGPGEIAPVFEGDSLFHLVQLVERVEAGTLPKLTWVEDEVRRLLLMQRRKQMVARQVQRLRNEAASREALEIR